MNNFASGLTSFLNRFTRTGPTANVGATANQDINLDKETEKAKAIIANHDRLIQGIKQSIQDISERPGELPKTFGSFNKMTPTQKQILYNSKRSADRLIKDKNKQIKILNASKDAISKRLKRCTDKNSVCDNDAIQDAVRASEFITLQEETQEAEQDRLAQAAVEEDRLAQVERERLAQAAAEQDRLAQEERERLAQAAAEQERLAQIERERFQAAVEQDRLAQAAAEQERLAQIERERLTQARASQNLVDVLMGALSLPPPPRVPVSDLPIASLVPPVTETVTPPVTETVTPPVTEPVTLIDSRQPRKDDLVEVVMGALQTPHTAADTVDTVDAVDTGTIPLVVTGLADNANTADGPAARPSINSLFGPAVQRINRPPIRFIYNGSSDTASVTSSSNGSSSVSSNVSSSGSSNVSSSGSSSVSSNGSSNVSSNGSSSVSSNGSSSVSSSVSSETTGSRVIRVPVRNPLHANAPATPIIAAPATPIIAAPAPSIIAAPSTPIIAAPSTPIIAAPTKPSTPIIAAPTKPSTPIIAAPTKPSAPIIAAPTKPSAPALGANSAWTLIDKIRHYLKLFVSQFNPKEIIVYSDKVDLSNLPTKIKDYLKTNKNLIYVEHYWTKPDPKRKAASPPASPLQKTYVFMDRKTYEFKTFTIAGDGSVASPVGAAASDSKGNGADAANVATDNVIGATDKGNGDAVKVKDAVTQCLPDHLRNVIAKGFHKGGLLDMIRMIINDGKKIFETHLNKSGTNRLNIANEMVTSLNTKINQKADLMQMLQNVSTKPTSFITTEILGLLGENKTCKNGKGQLFLPTEEALVGLQELRDQLQAIGPKSIEPKSIPDDQTIESVYSQVELETIEQDDKSVLSKALNGRKRPRL